MKVAVRHRHPRPRRLPASQLSHRRLDLLKEEKVQLESEQRRPSRHLMSLYVLLPHLIKRIHGFDLNSEIFKDAPKPAVTKSSESTAKKEKTATVAVSKKEATTASAKPTTSSRVEEASTKSKKAKKPKTEVSEGQLGLDNYELSAADVSGKSHCSSKFKK